jgi:hypothetical protein
VKVVLTARRDAERRTRTVEEADAEEEAERLRADGWSVTVASQAKSRETERTRKQRAAVIAAHRHARRARQGADDQARGTDSD